MTQTIKEVIFSRNLIKVPNLQQHAISDSHSQNVNFHTDGCLPLAWEATVEGCYPQFGEGIFSSSMYGDLYKLESAQKWITYPGKYEVQFPLQTILPQVRMLRIVKPKELPRDVEVDRRRRKYAKLNIKVLLQDAGVNSDEELPPPPRSLKHFLHLDIFDDETFDCNTPQGWLNTGLIMGVQHPLPAWAFLPTTTRTEEDGFFSWKMVAVEDYNPSDKLWRVRDLEEGLLFRIPRIHLMFIAENPLVFVERIQTAINERMWAENCLKFQAVIDCVLMSTLPEMKLIHMERIEKLTKFVSKIQKPTSATYLVSIKNEIGLIYHRVMAAYKFEKFLHMHPEEFPSIDKDIIRKKRIKLDILSKIKMKEIFLEFATIRDVIRRSSLFYVYQSIQAMLRAATECAYIETLSLYACTFTKAVTLSEFIALQKSTCSITAKYLKESWPENLAKQISMTLRSIGKGWLDLATNDWTVFFVAKISRFIFQVKLRMQESLQILLENSIINYSKLLYGPCVDFLPLDVESFEWPDDFITTRFATHTTQPIFCLTLNLSATAPYYSTDPQDFEPAITDILYSSLMQIVAIRRIDPECIIKLNFAHNLYILTVELIEDVYVDNRDILNMSYKQAVIPLNAYAKRYERFIPLYVLNVNEFIAEFAAAKKPSLEVKNEILFNKERKQELREILPATIVIGPFLVIVDPLKQYLINKRIEIIRRLFEYYVNRMWETTENILDQCYEINGKLTEKSTSIEHVYEIKEYILSVPDKVDGLREKIQIMMLEYDILDSFFYNLSDTQFGMKWEAYAWPHKIIMRLSTIKEEHKNDIEEFKRIQISEVTNFQERLESLNEEIMTFSLQFDANRALETAVEVKKTWKVIQEMLKLGKVLQSRQALFELEEISMEFLDSIIESFTPYRNLWNASCDFLKLEEATIGNPLTNIVVAEVRSALNTLEEALRESYRIFVEKIEIQNVAQVYLDKIVDFQPVVDVIEWIKDPNWLIVHWQEFVQQTGVDIKFALSMNFHYCIRKGMMQHYETARQIFEKAVLEADAIRKALEEEERLRHEAEMALLLRKQMRKCRTDIL